MTGELTELLARAPGPLGLGQLPKDRIPTATTTLVCGFCSTGCGLDVHLRDGRIVSASANGARGYPERPASDEEMATKFLGCAARTLARDAAEHALALLRSLESLVDVRALTSLCTSEQKSELRRHENTKNDQSS